MKIGLFLALLVLLASTNVFGQDEVKKVGRKNRPSSNEIAANQDEFEQNNHSRDSQHDTNTPDQAVHDVDTVLPEEPTSNRIKLVQKADVSVNVPSTDRQPFVKKPASKFEGITTKKVTKPEEGIPKQRVEVKPIVADDEVEPEAHADEHVTPSDTENHADESRLRVKPTDTKPSVKPSKAFHETNRPGSQSDDLRNDDEIVVKEVKPLKSVVPKRISQDSFVLENTVHVSGSIALTRYRPLAIDSVQYETKGGRLNSNSHGSMKARLSASQDYVAPQSRVVLYVATVKTIDRKLAFANFSIGLAGDHFPLAFNVHVPLPNELLGLVETADITLYFFAYVTNADSRIDAFLPDGTSQILLQGTNRVVQQLQINVKANGMEIKGLFRGRYSQRYIRTGTAFQVLIVPEQSLSRLLGESIESIAQFTINNVPAMYPVPFSLLVPHQELKPKTKYYAIAYIFENGVERLIKQKAILVINENKVLVTPDISFTIVPHPFILHGTVARAMPGPFYFEPNSSIILSLHEKDSDSPAFTFRLPIIAKLPQDIQVNISQASQFDATKDYEILAMVTDDKNRIYMTSLQKIPILDQMSRLTIPVDDFFYYVQVRLHSPVSQQLTYIPGSKASLIVTENPETTGTPIFDAQFDPTTPDFREYLMKIPITRAQRYRNAYLILLINNTGIITHVSKILLISNNQPPPLRIELPVIPLNLIRGFIHDSENRVAQWSSSSYANLYLLDDQIASPEKAIVQTWKIHLEREFPVRFEVPVDFSRLLPGHKYSLQSTIENGPAVFEYKPANSVSVIEPDQRIKDNLRVLVKNVKKSQFVNGLIYISDVPEPLQEHGQLIIQLSSSPSLTAPEIIHETRLDVEKRRLPVNFTMELPLDHIDISSVYYFLVQYVIGNTVVVPVTQAFAFSPRNEATVVLRLTKTRQIRITGQISSTGGRLVLPIDSTLHLYITDNPQSDKSFIYSDVRLQASTNSQYQFTMYLDAVILQRNITLYLRADILHQKAVLLSIPRPALLQITPGGEWNINLVLDLPTLLVGQITSSGQQEDVHGEFEVYIQVLPRGTNNVVRTSRLRLAATLPQPFRVEIENELFVEYPELEVRALIKNCKEEILFKSGGAVDIHTRLNVDLNLPVVITDLNKLKELSINTAVSAPLQAGQWRLSVTGIVPGTEAGVMATLDNGLIPQK